MFTDVRRILREGVETLGRDAEIKRALCADQFAKLDGFPDYAAFWRFHSDHRRKDAPPVIARELIGFGAVTEAFAQP